MICSRIILAISLVWAFPACSLFADMVVLEGVDTPTMTTGDLLDGADYLGRTVGVVEIPGLLMTARSVDNTQVVNVNTTSFGINSSGNSDDSDAFDAGESVIISFSKDIRINLLDLNLFDDVSESFTVAVGDSSSFTIAYDDLSDQRSAFFSTNLIVAANTEITFSTSSPTPIGLDGIDLDVIPEPAAVSLIGLCGIGFLVMRRLFS